MSIEELIATPLDELIKRDRMNTKPSLKRRRSHDHTGGTSSPRTREPNPDSHSSRSDNRRGSLGSFQRKKARTNWDGNSRRPSEFRDNVIPAGGRANAVFQQTKSAFSDVKKLQTIALLLGVHQCPVDGNSRSLVRVKVKHVPNGILSSGYSGTVFTPVAQSCSPSGNVQNNRQFSDDNAYKNHPSLRLVLPRCYSILLIFKDDRAKGGEARVVAKHILQGFYKFGGHARDEDSHVGSDGLYQQCPLSQATRIVLSEKVNGKAANFTAFTLEGQQFLLGGSKSEHHVVRADAAHMHADIEHLDRNHFAYHIWLAFARVWESLSHASRNVLFEDLSGGTNQWRSNASGFSICGEWLDGKHMVPLLPRDGAMEMKSSNSSSSSSNTRGRGSSKFQSQEANGSDEVEDYLVVFGLVENRGAIQQRASLCMDIVPVLEFFSELGFPIIEYEVMSPRELESRRDILRAGRMSEGWVIHYQKRDQSKKKFACIAIEKYKLWWYIILRVIRQFVMSHDLKNWRSVLEKRLRQRNQDFMLMPEPLLQKWIGLAKKFVAWFLNSGRYFNSGKQNIGFGIESAGMGNMWLSFLEENSGVSDDFSVSDINGTPSRKRKQAAEIIVNRSVKSKNDHNATPNSSSSSSSSSSSNNNVAPRGRGSVSYSPRTSLSATNRGGAFEQTTIDLSMDDVGSAVGGGARVLVVMQGTCGLGKTTISSHLVDYLKSKGIYATALEQDAFVRFGKRQAGRRCQAEFESYVAANEYQVVFLQRNNACLGQFERYAGAARDGGWLVHVVAPSTLVRPPHAALVALQSVFERFPKRDHPSFRDLPLDKQFQITMSFLAVFETPSATHPLIDHVTKVDWLIPGASINRLDDRVTQYFGNYLRHMRRAPFQAQAKHADEVVHSLDLQNGKYQLWRRTPEHLAKEIGQAIVDADSLKAEPALQALINRAKHQGSRRVLAPRNPTPLKYNGRGGENRGFQQQNPRGAAGRLEAPPMGGGHRRRRSTSAGGGPLIVDSRGPSSSPIQQSKPGGDGLKKLVVTSKSGTDIISRSNNSSNSGARSKGQLLYVCLKLTDAHKYKLRELLGEFVLDMSGITNQKLSHLTLMFKKQKDANPALWHELQSNGGQEVAIVVTGIAYSPKNVACFGCELRSELGGLGAGVNLRRMCESGVPHITVATAQNVSPVESKLLLARLRSRRQTKGETFSRIPEEKRLNFMTKVSLVWTHSQRGR